MCYRVARGLSVEEVPAMERIINIITNIGIAVCMIFTGAIVAFAFLA